MVLCLYPNKIRYKLKETISVILVSQHKNHNSFVKFVICCNIKKKKIHIYIIYNLVIIINLTASVALF